jgi:GNAT superfamily N-acetyltransferase
MTFTIRTIEPGDLGRLLALYRQLNPSDPTLPDDVARARFEEMLNHPGLVVFCGFVDDQLATTCVLHVLPNLTRGGAPYALIENVVTDGAHRRKGLGQAIVRAAAEAGLERGCYKIMLMTGRSDPGVLAFYESCGFSQSKTGFQMRAGGAGAVNSVAG